MGHGRLPARRNGERGRSARSRAIAVRWHRMPGDVAGFVAGVNERISSNLKMLDRPRGGHQRLLADQAAGVGSTDEARVLADQARGKLDQGRGAIEDTRSGSSPPSPTSSSSSATAWPASPRRLTRVQNVSVEHRDHRQQDRHARAQRRPSRRRAADVGPLFARSSPPR